MKRRTIGAAASAPLGQGAAPGALFPNDSGPQERADCRGEVWGCGVCCGGRSPGRLQAVSYLVQLIDQELRLQLDRVGSIEPFEVLEQSQLQLDRLHEDRLQEDRLQDERLQEDRLQDERLQLDRL